MSRLTTLAIFALLIAALALAFGPQLLVPFSQDRTEGATSSTPSDAPSIGTSVQLLEGPFTLAVSWQPAFCEFSANRPECRSQTSDRFDARNLTLHGLWPDPIGNTYCNVPSEIADDDRNGQWGRLPELELSDSVWRALVQTMPGTQSLLHRHEWIKHGTCSGLSAEDYYGRSIELVSQLNAAGLADLFANNVGDILRAEDIRSSFDKALGRGAGSRVTVECERGEGRTLVAELRIALVADGASNDLVKMIVAAPTRSRGCPSGEVDAVGQN